MMPPSRQTDVAVVGLCQATERDRVLTFFSFAGSSIVDWLIGVATTPRSDVDHTDPVRAGGRVLPLVGRPVDED